MKVGLLSPAVFGLVLGVSAFAQDAPASRSTIPTQPQSASQDQRAGGRGGWGMGMGRGLAGAVTAVAADHYTIKTDAGETYTVYFSVNTRILKQPTGGRGPGRGGQRGQGGGGDGSAGGSGTSGSGGGTGSGSESGTPPQPLKPTDIKVGDAIGAMGEVDATAKSVGAVMIFQIDPERAKQMREMQANYGKTWLMGKVTAIDGVKVTLVGAPDNAAHSFIADENTTFRKRREPITLADIQVGDSVRAEGAVRDGSFLATAVNAMTPQGQPPSVPRNAAAPPQ